MLTEEELLNLKSFGKEDDGSFSDRWEIVLRPKNKKRTMWKMYAFDEVDGSEEFLIDVNSMDELNDYYFNITNKNLE